MVSGSASFSAVAFSGIPLVKQGDDLVRLILDAYFHENIEPQSGDVLVISSKIVSKAEGRVVMLDAIEPSSEARLLAEETGKDPRIVELILKESVGVSRKRFGVLVVEHKLGFVCANAGIDQSNIGTEIESVLLLPEDPDKSAQHIREALLDKTQQDIGIVISDTHGRPFRVGNIGVAVGVSGLPAVLDLRGQVDLFGRVMQVSVQGYADLVASAAHLLCGETNEGRPVVLMRGLQYERRDGKASDINRIASEDLYR